MDTVKITRQYNWHAVYLNYRMEKKVLNSLVGKNIECYLPLLLKKRVWSDRIKIIEEPVFSGYIFVRISALEYYDVLVTKGVLKYVSIKNKPVIIRDSLIDSLKLIMENSNQEIKVTSERLEKGSYVKIVKGPFKNAIGEVLKVKDKNRLVLRFSPLGFNVQVDLGDNEVEVHVNTTLTTA